VSRRIYGDKGYRGHNYPNRFKVWITGQVRRVTNTIRREMRRRAALEPVIGRLKEDHRMGRNYLTGRDGDRINVVLAPAGYNFSLLLRWFEELLCALLLIPWRALFAPSPNPNFLHGAAGDLLKGDYDLGLGNTGYGAIGGVDVGLRPSIPRWATFDAVS
jgi:hypothetical protein